MDEIMSYCGLSCQTCQIYLASRETDQSKKEKILDEIIHMFKVHYGIDCKYEDINECDGCKSGPDRLYFRCKECTIRKCAEIKGIENCAYCDEFACEDLLKIFKAEPGAEERLRRIRKIN
jgi:hypothetical protein